MPKYKIYAGFINTPEEECYQGICGFPNEFEAESAARDYAIDIYEQDSTKMTWDDCRRFLAIMYYNNKLGQVPIKEVDYCYEACVNEEIQYWVEPYTYSDNILDN